MSATPRTTCKPAKKAPVLRLVRSTPPVSPVSLDTIECLKELLEDARRGELAGFAFVTLNRNRKSVVDVTGEALRHPIYTRGLVADLSDLLGELARDD